jgi:hypothetical protein
MAFRYDGLLVIMRPICAVTIELTTDLADPRYDDFTLQSQAILLH